jgi:hypothetical protein
MNAFQKQLRWRFVLLLSPLPHPRRQLTRSASYNRA